MIDVTEWIIDLLICGIAIISWGIGLLIITMLFSVLNKYIDGWRNSPEEEK